MSNFKSRLLLSNKEIKAENAELYFEDAKQGMLDIIQDKESEIRDVRRAILQIRNFHAKTKDSLSPVHENFCGKKYSKELSEKVLTLHLLNQELKVLKELDSEEYQDDVEVKKKKKKKGNGGSSETISE